MHRSVKTSTSAERRQPSRGSMWRCLAGLSLVGLLDGCAAFGGSGPSTASIVRAGKPGAENAIALVDVDAGAVARLGAMHVRHGFAETLGDADADPTVIGSGDSIDITLWEAPPALLFGSGGGLAGLATSQSLNLPQQMVGNDGRVTIPFVGSVAVAGRTTRQVERDLVAGLKGKANAPQALVRISQNEARTVTVLGEVAASRRVPLTSRGERLLDAIAAAGGSRQPVGKTTVQMTRAATTLSMPLDDVIRDPRQNIRLRPGDVVAVLFQPFSFTALGAGNLSAQVPFEATGMSLAEALGRIGGLRDDRADIKGIFVFRYEDAEVVGPLAQGKTRQDGKVATVYRLDLSNPSSLLLSQSFALRDKDVVFVSSAPAADFQKFLGIVTSATFSVVGITNAVQ